MYPGDRAKLTAVQHLRSAHLLVVIACAVATALTSCAHLGSPAADAAPTATTATVLRVVDGDTIDVRDDTRGRLRIRQQRELASEPCGDAPVDRATTVPTIGATPLPHLERCAAAYREEYGGNEYGGLPVKVAC